MAKNKNSSSEGVCQKIKSTFRWLSPQPAAHVVHHQPNFSKTIPIESEPTIAPKMGKTDIVIANGHGSNAGKPDPRKGHHVRIEKAKTNKHDGRVHEGSHEDPDDNAFSDYINKVKRRMLNSVSTVKGESKSTVGYSKSVTFKR